MSGTAADGQIGLLQEFSDWPAYAMGFAALMGEHTQNDNVGAAAIVIPSRPSVASKTTPGSSSRTSLGVEVSKFSM